MPGAINNIYDFLIGNDIKSLTSKSSSLTERLEGGAFIALNLFPEGKFGRFAKVFKLGHRGERCVSVVARSFDDLASLKGATPEEIEKLVPKDWISQPLRKGEGVRYLNPERPGEAILIEKGWANATDSLHRGPYVKISRNGSVTRIPLKGNPVLNE